MAEVFGKTDDDIASVNSLASGGGSDICGPGLVKRKEAGPSKEIGQLRITLWDDCFGLVPGED